MSDFLCVEIGHIWISSDWLSNERAVYVTGGLHTGFKEFEVVESSYLLPDR